MAERNRQSISAASFPTDPICHPRLSNEPVEKGAAILGSPCPVFAVSGLPAEILTPDRVFIIFDVLYHGPVIPGVARSTD